MIWKGVGAGSGVHDIPPLPRRREAGIPLVDEELVRPPPLAARSPRCIPSAKSSSTETDFAIASGLASRTCASHFSPSVSAATLNDSVAPEARPPHPCADASASVRSPAAPCPARRYYGQEVRTRRSWRSPGATQRAGLLSTARRVGSVCRSEQGGGLNAPTSSSSMSMSMSTSMSVSSV